MENEKLFLTPEEFANRSGLKISHVRWLCRSGKLECIRTERGGHYKISTRVLLEYGNSNNNKNADVNKDYEALIKENERLRTKLDMIFNIAAKINKN